MCLLFIDADWCFDFVWMSNAACTHVPFPPNIRCAGWGWGRSTLGCSPPFNMLLLCVGEAPLLVKQWAGHILAYKRWLQWVFICAKVGIASDAVTGWETWGHRGDSLKHVYLISSNAFDLSLNDWPPERVFHDTYPNQLLRSNYYLPMDSVMGNSIGGLKFTFDMNLEFLNSAICSWYLNKRLFSTSILCPLQTGAHTVQSKNNHLCARYILACNIYMSSTFA